MAERDRTGRDRRPSMSSSTGGHREKEKDHLPPIVTSGSGGTSGSGSGSGTGGVSGGGGSGGFFSKLIGRAGSTSRTTTTTTTSTSASSSTADPHPHPFHRTRSDISTSSSSHSHSHSYVHKNTTTTGAGPGAGSSYSGSPATSPVLSPTSTVGLPGIGGGLGLGLRDGRSARKSGLGSAEVIRGGDYDRDRSREREGGSRKVSGTGGGVGGMHHVDSVREESTDDVSSHGDDPLTLTTDPSHPDRDVSWEQLVAIVKGEPGRMASVPGEDEDVGLGLDRVEAVRMVTRRLNRMRERRRMEDESRDGQGQGRGEVAAPSSSTSKQQAGREDQGGGGGGGGGKGGTGLPEVLGSRDKLLDLVLPLCSVEIDPRVRSAGFDLLASILRAATSTSALQTDLHEPTSSIAHSPWVLAGTILNLPMDLPSNISFRYHLTDDIPSSQSLDLYGRTACLVELTDHGKDISVDLDMIKVLVRWLNLMSAEWVRACSRGTPAAASASAGVGSNKGLLESVVGSGLGLGLAGTGTRESMDYGRRGSRAGVQRDEANSQPPPSPEHTLKTILLLSDLLLNIMKHNLALFTPNDTSHILNVYLDTIKRGIRHTPGSHPLLNPNFPGYGGRSDPTPPPEPKTKTSLASHERTSSVLNSLRKPSKVAPVAAISTELPRLSTTSMPSTLSRHPSVRSKGEKGFATTAVSAGPERLIDLPGMPEGKPYWSTMIPFLVELTRMLLKAKSLSPLDLPAIMSLLALCSGWRAISTHVSFRLDGGDRAVITNALELRDRDGIIALVRDIIVSRMIGRSGEKALRGVLGMDRGRGREKSTYHVGRDEGLRGRDRLLGVICLLRELLKSTHHVPARSEITPAPLSENFKLSSFAPSLLSAMRFSHTGNSTQTQEFADAWHDIDLEILGIVDDHIKSLQNAASERANNPEPFGLPIPGNPHGQENKSGSGRHQDAWTEGELVCQFLDRAKKWITTNTDAEQARLILTPEFLLGDHDGLPIVDHRLIRLFLDLPSVLSKMQSTATGNAFFHPDFVDILIQMSGFLTEDNTLALLDYYEREGACLPPTERWTGNINRILDAFYVVTPKDQLPSSNRATSSAVRRRTASLVFTHVYGYVAEDRKLRNQLVQEVLLNLAERTLLSEHDPQVEKMFWQVIVDFVSSDSIDKDEERRAHRAELEKTNQPMPALSLSELVEGDSFDRLRVLSLQALSSPCNQHAETLTRNNSERREPTGRNFRERLPHAQQNRGDTEEDHSRSNSGGLSLKGIMEAISPTSVHRELPSISGRTGAMSPRSEAEETTSPRPESISESIADAMRPETASPEAIQQHPCKHTHTIATGITVFNRLAFSLPTSSGPARLGRLPASARCIIIFKDLVRLMAPSIPKREQSSTPTPSKPTPEDEFRDIVICPSARLLILQWSLRLRATQEHRIWMKQHLDADATSSASTLSRTQAQADAIKMGRVVDDSDPRRRVARPEPVTGDRGRVDRSMQDGSGRSRSRSRQPVRSAPYNPLWAIPDTLRFECPPDERPSEGMTTFDPRLTDTGSGDVTGPMGIWLPISEYLSVLNDILETDPDWDMVSYLLVFLPLQLANRHFYCGPRAKLQVKRLRRIICEGLLSDRLLHNVQLPAMLRKADVRGVAYQLLTILISYRKLYDRSECNSIVETLYRGLSGIHRSTTKQCVRALTVAAYELTDNLVTWLPGVLEQLSQIMGTPSTSLHILELLCSIGQIPALYGNFTDIQYKAVFQVAMKYIEIHHDDETKALADAAQTQDPEYFTLSQHVLKLSFFVIYTWYMALALPKRVTMYPHILRQLILCFPNEFDEMAEVCFDWLTRYTYGNADPKPATSHIGTVAMHHNGKTPLGVENSRTKYWLLGNSVLSITAHPRSGWATLNVRRASGTVGILCKIENVPTIGLGEDGADLDVLPAMMRADREEVTAISQASHPGSPLDENPGQTLEGLSAEDATDTEVVSVTPHHEMDSQFSFIWSGTAPSQRRKDVVIDPSFIGLQLSAYPYISASTPRGRFLPLDPTVERTLRNLDRIPVIDTQAIAVLYVGPGQTTEDEIFSNTNGSPGFLRFMAGLGRLIKLKGQRDVYTGGLDTQDDRDGEYAYAWWDDLIQVIYHAPHLMPNPETAPGEKPNYFTKKREVGNDYVKIVFNDSGLDYKFDTIKSDFQFINIVISQHTPGLSGTFKDSTEDNFYQVAIQRAPGIPDFAAIGDFKLISVKSLPLVVRQIGYYANVLSQLHLHTSTKGNLEYLTAWRQRWQKIQSLKNYLPKTPDIQEVESMNEVDRRQLLRDFTRGF